ncbi:hypothetical protein VKT23_018681 [Stygiomarasmius scandens]|uniref:F-box domain-containing protein n=1 Tax=Marasmiellus scandens TaxID=2682957 RepID=A0ABR1IRD7_9AGAR
MPSKRKRVSDTSSVRRSTRVASRQGWRVPPEILLLIMNEIQDSSITLKNAALVCRAWRHPAQVVLFSEMQLKSRGDCRRFIKILRKSPHLASNIIRLNVVERAFDSATSTKSGHYLQHPDVFKLFSDFLGVYSINLREVTVSAYPWNGFTMKILKPLGKTVHRLKIDECESVPCDSIVRILEMMPELDSLHLSYGERSGSYFGQTRSYAMQLSESDGEANRSEEIHSSLPKLASRSIKQLVLNRVEHRFDLMNYLLNPGHFDFSNLGYLSLTWMIVNDQQIIEDPEFEQLDQLFKRIGPSLTHLKIWLSSSIFHDEDLPDFYITHFTQNQTSSSLSYLTSVETVILDYASVWSEPVAGFSVSSQLALLSCLSGSRLKAIKLVIFFEADEFLLISERCKNRASEWESLDALLTDGTKFANLESVSVVFDIGFDALDMPIWVLHVSDWDDGHDMTVGEITQGFLALFEDCGHLAGLKKKGILDVSLNLIDRSTSDLTEGSAKIAEWD